jgi:uncharacterized protein YdaT
MRDHYDFSTGVPGKYAGKVNTADIRVRSFDKPDQTGPCMAKDELFVERRPQGDYAVRRGGSERASAIESTQAEAIERAKEINHGGPVLVARVRNTDVGQRDKWRKP